MSPHIITLVRVLWCLHETRDQRGRGTYHGICSCSGVPLSLSPLSLFLSPSPPSRFLILTHLSPFTHQEAVARGSNNSLGTKEQLPMDVDSDSGSQLSSTSDEEHTREQSPDSSSGRCVTTATIITPITVSNLFASLFCFSLSVSFFLHVSPLLC